MSEDSEFFYAHHNFKTTDEFIEFHARQMREIIRNLGEDEDPLDWCRGKLQHITERVKESCKKESYKAIEANLRKHGNTDKELSEWSDLFGENEKAIDEAEVTG